MRKFTLLALVMVQLLVTTGANAATEDEEYNFSWLDPDKKVYVLQNRKFRKAGRFGINAGGGLNLSNPFKTEYLLVPRLTYFFTEQLGLEAFYASITNADNSTMTALRSVSASSLPFVREHRNYFGGLLVWAPWYAKLNFFNQILYFDWFLNAGLGQVSTAVDHNVRPGGSPNFVLEDLTAAFVGTAMNFYLTKNFSVRLDLIGALYNAKGADNATDRLYTNFDFTAGLGYLF